MLDTMSAECFSKSLDLSLPAPAEATALLRDGCFDFVLVESAWQGNDGTWQYRVGSYASPQHRGLPDLRELTSTASDKGIPTVFWNKEDPVHFSRFAEAARLFDVVFTTDAHRIGAYRALRGRAQRVEALQFAAEPSLHNPLNSGSRLPSPVFAGTFYQRRHVDRQSSLRMLLEAAVPYGLVIYDRMHKSGQQGYDFPESVAGCIVGRLPYTELVDVYRRHRVFLNANSVVRSPTMFARRVFELLACGTAVVSTPSRGMEATFPSLVDSVESHADAKAALERLLFDDDYWFQRSMAGIRSVMLNHTYEHRVAQIARALGLKEPSAGPSVAVVCATAEEVRQVAPLICETRGLGEIAIPADTPGEIARLLYDCDSPLRRVVRVDVTDQDSAVQVAADWITSQWLLGARDLVRCRPADVTDLAAATVFSQVPAVVARSDAPRSSLFSLTRPQAGDVVVRRTEEVRKGRKAENALLASVGGGV